jgi:3-mercaptopyruvate sulfurtransferase SseA
MIRWNTRHISLIGLITGLIFVSPAFPGEPAWWRQAETEAKQDGYTLIHQEELKARYTDYLILDVRPAYEFEDGHIPGSKNLEFDLGDRMEVKPEKQNALKQLLGTNSQQPIVIYCRSYT